MGPTKLSPDWPVSSFTSRSPAATSDSDSSTPPPAVNQKRTLSPPSDRSRPSKRSTRDAVSRSTIRTASRVPSSMHDKFCETCRRPRRRGGQDTRMDLSDAPVVDVRPLLSDERKDLLRLLRGLTPDQWNMPTTAPDWSVKDVALH